MMACFECGETGHLARNCPNLAYVTGTGSDWCGYCDERTRLVDLGDTARRCTTCHPNRGKQLAQHRKCPSCHDTVFAWENGPCGSHQRLGPRIHVSTPPAVREPSRDLEALARAQAAEARAGRLVLDMQQDQHDDQPPADHEPGQGAEDQQRDDRAAAGPGDVPG